MLQKLGALSALSDLGIIKVSAIGAKTILPGMSKVPSLYTDGLRSLKNNPSRKLPKSVEEGSEVLKYYDLMGKPGGAAESSTSLAFRKELTEKARPQLQAFAPTMPAPPKVPSGTTSENLTVPPPSRRR